MRPRHSRAHLVAAAGFVGPSATAWPTTTLSLWASVGAVGLGQHGLLVTVPISDQLVGGDAVGDEHVDPASEKGAAQCGQFADATRYRDTARDRHQLLRADSD